MNDNNDTKDHSMNSGGVIGMAAAVLGIVGLGVFKIIKKGHDGECFDEKHYDEEGYDENGFDKYGYDRDGYNRDGYNCHKVDRNGYTRDGYKDGYDINGLDRQGYNKLGYNTNGIDRAGKNSEYYSQEFIKLRQKLSSAKKALDKGEYTHAIIDSRQSLEHALVMLISHKKGAASCGDSILDNLKICERYKIISDTELLNKLHNIRMICNKVHDIDANQELTHQTVYFVIMQLGDFFDSIEGKFLGI